MSFLRRNLQKFQISKHLKSSNFYVYASSINYSQKYNFSTIFTDSLQNSKKNVIFHQSFYNYSKSSKKSKKEEALEAQVVSQKDSDDESELSDDEMSFDTQQSGEESDYISDSEISDDENNINEGNDSDSDPFDDEDMLSSDIDSDFDENEENFDTKKEKNFNRKFEPKRQNFNEMNTRNITGTGTQVMIRNLDYNMTQDELYNVCNDMLLSNEDMSITNLYVPPNKDNRSMNRGFAFVTLDSNNTAQYLMNKLNNKRINNRNISLQWANEQPQQSKFSLDRNDRSDKRTFNTRNIRDDFALNKDDVILDVNLSSLPNEILSNDSVINQLFASMGEIIKKDNNNNIKVKLYERYMKIASATQGIGTMTPSNVENKKDDKEVWSKLLDDENEDENLSDSDVDLGVSDLDELSEGDSDIDFDDIGANEDNEDMDEDDNDNTKEDSDNDDSDNDDLDDDDFNFDEDSGSDSDKEKA